jgi:parallel beta-helix repeat protein
MDKIANCKLQIGKSANRKSQIAGSWLMAGLTCALACLLTGGVAVAQSGPAIVINEMQYHPLSDDYGEEYIELYNAGTMPVNLSGWQFSDGIAYTFPGGVSIPAGGYVVVGHDPATVEAIYGISGVLGPFDDGRLANEGERVALEDAGGVLVDEVTYDDDHPWPDEPDGKGPSLELINPAFDNARPCSWGSSTGPGTPGTQNSAYSAGNVAPCVTGVTHTPVQPASSQAVTVTAQVDDNSAVAAVVLRYRPEGTSGYVATTMTGGGGSLYTATIPAHGDGQYVEFHVTATDDEGATRSVPDGAPGSISAETGLPVTVSYLYLVENTPPTSTLPIYRLIVTHENLTELVTRPITSNVLLDAAFVYGGEAFYDVGLRYRGDTRTFTPRPYRVKFPDEHEFESRERINLVSDELGREALAHDLFQRAGLPAPHTRFVTLFVNENRQGDYLDVENVDHDFLEAHFPGDDSGNLYRGTEHADLSYRGPDPDAYRLYYVKKTNEPVDDYSDVIALTDVLSNTPGTTFRAQVEAVADSDEWLRWFAVQAVLDNHEGALWIGNGDDYFLYHRPSDGRFVLISWDHDYTFLLPSHSIWEPNWLGPQVVRRILNYPDLTRRYYQEIASLVADEFSAAEMFPRIDALPDVVGSGDKDELRWYVTNRIPALNAQIPATTLSIKTNGGRDFATTRQTVTLEGDCSPLRDVTVNGNAVHYPTATTWRYTSALWARDNVFVVTDGLHRRTITVHWDFHSGTLTEDTTLFTSASPYVITEDIVVPAGLTLTIQPGVTLQFARDHALRVEGGRLLAAGTAARPIVFTRRESDYWGGILFLNTQADNQIRHAVIEYTREAIPNPRTHGVTAYGSNVTIADSVLRYTKTSVAFQSYPWGTQNSTVYLLRNEIYGIESDAVHVTGGYAFIQGNHIHDVRLGVYAFEGIEVSDMVTPAHVLDNHIHAISDDCLDLNHSSALIARNELHDCGDKGISIGDPVSTTLVNNLIYTCLGKDEDPYSGTGIAVKDGAVSRIVNNTLSGCRHGIYLYEGHAGLGGGTATIVNTIVWGNTAALELDAHSVVTVTYSDIEGGWPGEGNLNADPLFRSPQSGIYRLLAGSPCVDTGTPVGAPAEDVRGVYRPHGNGYDRGAHEFFEFFSCHLPLILRAYR